MTAYHLKSWSKAHGRTSNEFIAAVEIDRIYVNADDRSSLGYIERRMTAGERGSHTYYDAHRSAKGDTVVTTSDTITCTVPADAMAKIVEAAAAMPGYERIAQGDELSRFLMLKELARGVGWIGSRGKTLKKLAASFTVEI